MVPIFLPLASEMGVMHERMACPSRCTVQAPHSAAPQPNLVPVMPSVSRRAQRIGVAGSASTACSRPLTLSLLMMSVLLGGLSSNGLVDDAHLLFVHPATVHLDAGAGGFEVAKVCRRQRHVDGAVVLVQM